MIFKAGSLRKIGLIVLSSSVFASNASFAAKSIDVSKQPFPLGIETHTLMSANSAPVRILKSHTDENQMTHVRVQQLHAGYPVWGANAVVHVPTALQSSLMGTKSKNDFLRTINISPAIKKNGIFYADLNKELGFSAPQVYQTEDKQVAMINFIRGRFAQKNKSQPWTFTNEKADLMVYVDQNNKPHWAYLVTFSATTAKKLPKQPVVIVDAETQVIYKQWDNIKKLNFGMQSVSATGYGGNPLLGQWQYGKEKPVLPISRLAYKNLCFMQNAEVEVYKKTDYQIQIPGNIISFNCDQEMNQSGNFLEPEKGFFGQKNDAYSPVNDALYYGMVINKLYKEWYKVPVLTDKKGNPLLLSMNILYFDEDDYENAFWEPESQKMYFGLGGSELYPLVSLGIAAHEISHGFTEQHSNLIYREQSGALNESFSDMAISAASYYSSNQQETDWNTGSEVIKSNIGKDKSEWTAIRYFDDPVRDGYSIDHVKDIEKVEKLCARVAKNEDGVIDENDYQSCYVHLASGIYNKVFYRLANTPGWNAKSAFGVMVKANQDYWTPNSTFQSAACGVKDATQDLAKTNSSYQLADVEKAFREVGIYLSDC